MPDPADKTPASLTEAVQAEARHRGPDMAETYLGDGLYARFDGCNVILRAPRAAEDHWVALEPSVWNDLLRWAQSVGLPLTVR